MSNSENGGAAATKPGTSGPWLARSLDLLVCCAIVAGYTTWLLQSVHDLGYARDEGFYFQAADSYLKWFKRLAEDPSVALQQKTIDRYWRVNSEHPALIKSLFAAGRHFLHDKWHWVDEAGTAYRAVGMAFSSAAVAAVYLWGRQVFGIAAGLMAAGLFAFIPRVFYHAHLDCFDMPVLAMWVFTSMIYWRSLIAERLHSRLLWSIAAGVAYGLLLNSKHNSWLMPFALIAHVGLTQGPALLSGLRRFRLRVPPALWFMATLGPLLFYGTWPWIWSKTLRRLEEYVRFHTAHVYYNMEFLGETYFEPPFPRSYSWLMTVGTVPAITLVLAIVGIVGLLWELQGERLRPWLARVRSLGLWKGTLNLTGSQEPKPLRIARDTQILWGLFILISYAPWVFSSSPIFGGTKHWMIAYPFLALFGGVAFSRVVQKLRHQLPVTARWIPVEGLVAASILVGPLTQSANTHPWGLSQYTPLVGGAAGGATLGLNRSFWGYTTGAVQDVINERARNRAKTFVHDTAIQSWKMMRKDGRVRKDLRPQLGVAWSHIGVYHHEQHMSRVEHQIWVDYQTVRPIHVAGLDGVPVVWVYQRPKKK